jgi:hypothetical protein
VKITGSNPVGATNTSIAATFSVPGAATIGIVSLFVSNNTAVDGSRPLSGPVNFQITPAAATPVNFRQASVIDAGNGDLRFAYRWDSSTGNPADLSASGVEEIVTYPDTRNPWPFPPLFPADAYPNPTPLAPDIPGTDLGLRDDQFLTPSTLFRKPYFTADFSAKQYYRYRCSNSNGGNYVNFLGPLYITRLVSRNLNGSWAFYVTKSGAVARINPLS